MRQIDNQTLKFHNRWVKFHCPDLTRYPELDPTGQPVPNNFDFTFYSQDLVSMMDAAKVCEIWFVRLKLKYKTPTYKTAKKYTLLLHTTPPPPHSGLKIWENFYLHFCSLQIVL